MTILDRPLKRQISVEGDPFVVTISPAGIRIVPKGKRKGYEISWASLISGESALQAQLAQSLAARAAG